MRIDARSRRWSRLLAGTACAAAMTLGLPAAALAAPAPTPAASAAPSADATQRARTAWETHGHPAALVVVRPTSVDLVDRGRLTRRVPRAGGAVTLAGLDRYLPRDWLSITDGTARLSAAVVLTPGTALSVAAPVTTLQLAGGATPSDAASIYTGGGALTLRGVGVTSVDRASGQVMGAGPGRPFVLVSPGGRFTATDATISDLGTAPRDARAQADAEDHPGLDLHTGSTGSLVRTSVLRNGTGLKLDGTQGVRLEDVTVSGAAGTGLVLRGDRGTTMSRVRAEHNGAYGVQVVGPSTDRAVTGISTTGNGGYGIGLEKQTGTRVTGVTTSGDESGGVELSQSTDVTVSELTTIDEPVGVFTHVNNTNIVLDRLAVTGGRRGVVVEKTTRNLTLQASTVRGATVAGIADDGKDIVLRDVTVSDSRTGLRADVHLRHGDPPHRPRHPRAVARSRARRRRRRGRRVRRDRHRRGEPLPAHPLARPRPGGGPRHAHRGGAERPVPATAEPARRHRHPAGPAGGVAPGDRGPAGPPLRRRHPADPAGPAGLLRSGSGGEAPVPRRARGARTRGLTPHPVPGKPRSGRETS